METYNLELNNLRGASEFPAHTRHGFLTMTAGGKALLLIPASQFLALWQYGCQTCLCRASQCLMYMFLLHTLCRGMGCYVSPSNLWLLHWDMQCSILMLHQLKTCIVSLSYSTIFRLVLQWPQPRFHCLQIWVITLPIDTAILVHPLPSLWSHLFL